VVKQLRFNVLFRYFAGLGAEDTIPDDTSLVVFRRRLGEERFEKIFDEFIQQCKHKGLLQERLKLIDATHIIADIAIPNTIGLLREGRKRVLEGITKERNKLDESLKQYYPKPPSRKPSKEDLAEELSLFKDLIRKIRGKHSSLVEKMIDLLEKAVEPEKKRKVVSFVDPDARLAKKE